jgi:hypothetical protein
MPAHSLNLQPNQAAVSPAPTPHASAPGPTLSKPHSWHVIYINRPFEKPFCPIIDTVNHRLVRLALRPGAAQARTAAVRELLVQDSWLGLAPDPAEGQRDHAPGAHTWTAGPGHEDNVTAFPCAPAVLRAAQLQCCRC